MARLPSKQDLSGPGSFRSGRTYSSADTSAIGRGLTNFGAGIARAGQEISAEAAEINEQRRKETIVSEFGPADSTLRAAALDFKRSLETSTDYANIGKRWDAWVDKNVPQFGKMITDPRAREEAVNDWRAWAVSQRDQVLRDATNRARSARAVSLAQSLDQYQRVYVDPATPEAERRNVGAAMEGLIASSEQTGIITPETAYNWRRKYREGSELTFAKLWVEQNGGPRQVRPAAVRPDVQARGSQAIRFFVGRGFTQAQAAGIVGNLIHESGGLNTGARNPGDGQDGSDSIGLAQWNAERASALKAFASARGKDWTDFQTQLEFIDHEMRTGTDGSGGMALRSLQEARTVEEAAAAFMHYERPRGYSAGNPRAGHGWQSRLANAAAFATGEVMDTGPAVPPNYDRLSPEDQYEIDAFASTRSDQLARDRAAGLKADQAAARDRFALQIATEDPNLTEDQILSHPLVDDGQKAELVNSLRAKRQETRDLATFIQGVTDGSIAPEPFSSSMQSNVDKAFDRLVQTAPETAPAVAEDFAARTGITPKGYVGRLRAELASGDPARVLQGLQAAQRLRSVSPTALMREGADTVEKAGVAFKHMVEDLGFTPDEAARKYAAINDPERRASINEDTVSEQVKKITIETVTNAFDSVWASEAAAGFTADQQNALVGDFRELFRMNYLETGDSDVARAMAVGQFRRLYGETRVNGSPVLVKYPPENYYPAVRRGGVMETGYEWMQEQALREIHAATGDTDITLDRVFIASTPRTSADVRGKQPPSYVLGYITEDDSGYMVPTIIQTGMQFQFDAAAAQAAAREAEAARRKAEYDAERQMQDIRRGMGPVPGSQAAPVPVVRPEDITPSTGMVGRGGTLTDEQKKAIADQRNADAQAQRKLVEDLSAAPDQYLQDLAKMRQDLIDDPIEPEEPPPPAMGARQGFMRKKK